MTVCINPKPQTPNPKPQTLNPNSGVRSTFQDSGDFLFRAGDEIKAGYMNQLLLFEVPKKQYKSQTPKQPKTVSRHHDDARTCTSSWLEAFSYTGRKSAGFRV